MQDGDVLIVGGEDHKSGQAEDMDERLTRLEQWARARFPSLGGIEWRWSGQVMESVDGLGYLGRNPGNDNVYVITGDSGMGMTHATIGARIAADLIAGRPNRWAELFAPGRISLKAAGSYAHENLNVVAQMADHVTPGEVASPDDILLGEGAVMRRGLHKVAVYRSFEGEVVERSAVCPHVGCVVAWNKLEGCWDCPCHGSQFAADGRVINGPATSDLAEIKEDHANPGSASANRTSKPVV
jgi:nitrite reductase/ring-hydroxylating ferredoxin subunit